MQTKSYSYRKYTAAAITKSFSDDESDSYWIFLTPSNISNTRRTQLNTYTRPTQRNHWPLSSLCQRANTVKCDGHVLHAACEVTEVADEDRGSSATFSQAALMCNTVITMSKVHTWRAKQFSHDLQHEPCHFRTCWWRPGNLSAFVWKAVSELEDSNLEKQQPTTTKNSAHVFGTFKKRYFRTSRKSCCWEEHNTMPPQGASDILMKRKVERHSKMISTKEWKSLERNPPKQNKTKQPPPP